MDCDFLCFAPLGEIKITCTLPAGKREERCFNMKLDYKGQMRKLGAEKSEGSKEGIGAMSFGWRWGKKSHGKLLQIKMPSSSAPAELSESLAVLKEQKEVSSSISFPLTCQPKA